MAVEKYENTSIREAKTKSKHLHSILKKLLPNIALGQCLDIFAKINGHRSWYAMSGSLNKTSDSTSPQSNVDSFIDTSLVPAMRLCALKHGLELSALAATKAAGELAYSDHEEMIRGTDIHFNPTGDSHCEGEYKLRVTPSYIRIDYGELIFPFPGDAANVATQIIRSEVLQHEEASLLRTVHDGQSMYFLNMPMSYLLSQEITKGIPLKDNKEVLDSFVESFDRHLNEVMPLMMAFEAFHGKWADKKLFRAFESAIWKAFHDKPRYTAESTEFHRAAFSGITFSATLSLDGPHISASGSKSLGGVAIGPSDIRYYDATEASEFKDSDKYPPGYYILKHGTEPRVHLEGLDAEAAARVGAEFGIPFHGNGILSEAQEFTFFSSPAFRGLQTWMKKHPRHAKYYSKKGNHYLPQWYERATSTHEGGSSR